MLRAEFLATTQAISSHSTLTGNGCRQALSSHAFNYHGRPSALDNSLPVTRPRTAYAGHGPLCGGCFSGTISAGHAKSANRHTCRHLRYRSISVGRVLPYLFGACAPGYMGLVAVPGSATHMQVPNMTSMGSFGASLSVKNPSLQSAPHKQPTRDQAARSQPIWE